MSEKKGGACQTLGEAPVPSRHIFSALDSGVSRPSLHLKDTAKIRQSFNIRDMSPKDLTFYFFSCLIFSQLIFSSVEVMLSRNHSKIIIHEFGWQF